MEDKDPDWLGELRWPAAGRPPTSSAAPVKAPSGGLSPPADSHRAAETESRLLDLAKENETLRARLDLLKKLASDFERRLNEAGAAYESAVFDAESRLRDVTLERERLLGEAAAVQAETARLSARDVTREAELRLERERRTDTEKALLETRRRLEEASNEADRLKSAAAEQTGALSELRRQASIQSEHLQQAKNLSDQDLQLLHQEVRALLTRFTPPAPPKNP